MTDIQTCLRLGSSRLSCLSRLGLYGGNDDVFLFYRRVLDLLGSRFQAVGSSEVARLASAAWPGHNTDADAQRSAG